MHVQQQRLGVEVNALALIRCEALVLEVALDARVGLPALDEVGEKMLNSVWVRISKSHT